MTISLNWLRLNNKDQVRDRKRGESIHPFFISNQVPAETLDLDFQRQIVCFE